MNTPTFVRLTDDERILGIPLDETPVSGRARSGFTITESPRAALEGIVAPYVRRDRCYVLFSGGRDSSTLLALATALARDSGAPDPIPVTARHPESPESDETEWQEFVLSHLGITEHVVLEFRGEQALLSDGAMVSLRRRGLLWPTPLHIQPAYLRDLAPGPVITGEGGDLTVSGRGITELLQAVRDRRPRRALRMVSRSMIPMRREAFRESYEDALPWLTNTGRERLASRTRPTREVLGWKADLERSVSQRAMRMGIANIVAVFADEGFDAVNPFFEPRFVRALGVAGGYFGLGNRTDLMRYLFSDLLPDAILARSTKAAFNSARFTAREHDFARSWSGAGIDPRFVDPEALRAAWLSDDAPPASGIHLHAAWLAENGLPLVPDVT